MTTGEQILVAVGVVAVAGVTIFAVSSRTKAVAAVANAQAASAASAAKSSGSPWDIGSLLSDLGGHALQAAAAYLSDGATLFNERADAKAQTLV